MDRMNAHTLAWDLAECVRYVRVRAPRATMDTMALPMGYVPRSNELLGVLLKGSEGGTSYQNRCILRAWGGPTFPLTHKHFDSRNILRIGSEPGYIEGWIKRLKRGGDTEPFVSDGDPNMVTVPRRSENLLCRDRLEGAQVVIYDGSPKHAQKKAALPIGRDATGRKKGA